MLSIKRKLPLAIAIAFGLLTLLGLLFLPDLSDLILGWVGFLAAFALLLGILNLLAVHTTRFINGRNFYSGILIISMLVVFGLAITDALAITENGVNNVFNWLQAPLEAALASLLAFFLLMAAFRMLKRQRSLWAILFSLTVVIVLLSQAIVVTTIFPAPIRTLFLQIQNTISNVITLGGMRGLLIGVALGSITLGLRLLLGLDQPYNK